MPDWLCFKRAASGSLAEVLERYVTYLVPNLAALYTGMQAKLPFATQM